MKLTPIAVWRTRTWPGAGGGKSTSTNFRTSGPPGCSKRIAFIVVHLCRREKNSLEKQGGIRFSSSRYPPPPGTGQSSGIASDLPMQDGLVGRGIKSGNLD